MEREFVKLVMRNVVHGADLQTAINRTVFQYERKMSANKLVRANERHNKLIVDTQPISCFGVIGKTQKGVTKMPTYCDWCGEELTHAGFYDNCLQANFCNNGCRYEFEKAMAEQNVDETNDGVYDDEDYYYDKAKDEQLDRIEAI